MLNQLSKRTKTLRVTVIYYKERLESTIDRLLYIFRLAVGSDFGPDFLTLSGLNTESGFDL